MGQKVACNPSLKTKVFGHQKIGHTEDVHTYDSTLEGRFARLLIKNRIEFTPHVEFKLFNPKGKKLIYVPDFVFAQPQKLVGIPNIVNVIEVKGWLSRKALMKSHALEYCKDMKCWIVSDFLIDFWEREGLF